MIVVKTLGVVLASLVVAVISLVVFIVGYAVVLSTFQNLNVHGETEFVVVLTLLWAAWLTFVLQKTREEVNGPYAAAVASWVTLLPLTTLVLLAVLTYKPN
jgi:hypothetical protein